MFDLNRTADVALGRLGRGGGKCIPAVLALTIALLLPPVCGCYFD